MPATGFNHTILRIHIDDVHHIKPSLRRILGDYTSLRLSVALEEGALSPCARARAMEDGELDFDRLILIFAKENIKQLFLDLYIDRPSGTEPEILASGRLGMSEIVPDGSTWTVPLFREGDPVCETTLCMDQLPPTEDMTDCTVYYPPNFASALAEVALGVRKATGPASAFCQMVTLELFLAPIRAGVLIRHAWDNVLRSLLS